MWTWLYGLCVSLYFWLLALDLHSFLVYLPLFTIGVVNIGAIVQKMVVKEDVSLLLAFLSCNILFTTLAYLQPVELYYIFSIIFGIITLLTMMYHVKSIFLSPPRWLSVLNATSLIISVVIYLMLYGIMKSHIEDFTVLFPLGLLIVLEAYATYHIYNGLDTITIEKCQEMAQNRLTYTTALVIIFIVTIIQVFDLISMNVNFGIAAVTYATLILVKSATYITRQCGSKATRSYQSLKEESINESSDV